MSRKTIVVSAVNLRKGGTLSILRQCLSYLSQRAEQDSGLRIVAIVHNRTLADYPNIEYLEMPKAVNSWARRLWYEYVTFKSVSKKLAPVYLWLSLHDTTPRVDAAHRAVYCQTSFPFLKFSFSDIIYDYKIALFSLFTRYAYRINIHKNDYVIVQSEWLKKGFSKMFHLDSSRFIVAPPQKKPIGEKEEDARLTAGKYTFLYPATPDCHKNFECVCEAAKLLEIEIGSSFQVILTISGSENRYSQSLFNQYGHNLQSLKFVGFLDKQTLNKYYWSSHCLIFPSRIETWGLPISEFAMMGKPMLLADMPYSHETAAGSHLVAFFDAQDSLSLKELMKKLVTGDSDCFQTVPSINYQGHFAANWKDLFDFLNRLD